MPRPYHFLRYFYFIAALSSLTVSPTSWASNEQTAQANLTPLVLGVFPRRRPTLTVELFEPLAKHLSQRIGREVKLETAKDFDTFWQNVINRRYDIVHYNQLHYIESQEKYRYDLIAINEEFGSKTISSAIIVRKDSGINSILDLKGKKIIFGGDATAMVAFVVNKLLLRRAGLKDGDYLEIIAKNPPNAVFTAFVKHADAAGAGENALRLPGITSQIKVEEMKILAESEPLPLHPWAVKQELDVTLKKLISQILLDLRLSDDGKMILHGAELTGISKARDADFDVIRHLMKELAPN